jgi:hypothetical protein
MAHNTTAAAARRLNFNSVKRNNETLAAQTPDTRAVVKASGRRATSTFCAHRIYAGL